MTLLSGVASINEIGTELRVFDAPNGIFADTLKIGWAAMPRKVQFYTWTAGKSCRTQECANAIMAWPCKSQAMTIHRRAAQTRFFSSCMLSPSPRISLVNTSKLAGVPASSVFSPFTMLS